MGTNKKESNVKKAANGKQTSKVKNTTVNKSGEPSFEEIKISGKKIDMMFEYLGMKKGMGFQVGSDDIMELRKMYTVFLNKNEKFTRMTPSKMACYTGSPSYIQRADAEARYKDIKDTLKEIDKLIVEGIKKNNVDYQKLYDSLKSSMNSKDKKSKAGGDLLASLEAYTELNKLSKNAIFTKKEEELKDTEREKLVEARSSIVEARQKLLDSCLNYMNSKTTSDMSAYNVIDEITKGLSDEGVGAFDKLTDKQLQSFYSRRHIVYLDDLGVHKVCHVEDYKSVKGTGDIAKAYAEAKGDYSDIKVQENITKYYKDYYANDSLSSRVVYEKLPWNQNIFKKYACDKKTFVEHQEKLRKFYGDTYSVLSNGAFKKAIKEFWNIVKNERDSAKTFLNKLDGMDLNSPVRRMKNSPEYEAVLKALKNYKKQDENETKISVAEKHKAVADACKAYLEHYENKTTKSQFAIKRRDEVKRVLEAFDVNMSKIEKNEQEALLPVEENYQAQIQVQM